MIVEHCTMPVVIANDYQSIDQNLTIFFRGIWDSEIIPLRQRVEENKIKIPNGSAGFTQLEWALRYAAWNACYDINPNNKWSFAACGYYPWEGKVNPQKVRFNKLEEASSVIKNAAKYYGADLVGIAEFDQRWIYSSWYDYNKKQDLPPQFPFRVKSVITVAVEVDYSACLTSPTLITCAATGLGYYRMGQVGIKLAAFIRNLGYNAIPSGNDTALSIPIAVQAGLGELGRNGILITPQYGPRVRLLKIFTDMPLQADKPITFGVSQFCIKCKKCAQFCPAGAITTEPKPTMKGPSVSNCSGVLKWYINPERCYEFWAINGGECNNCVACCPYNKWSSWHHGLTWKLSESIGGKGLLEDKNEIKDRFKGESDNNSIAIALYNASWEISKQTKKSQSGSLNQSLSNWDKTPNSNKTELGDSKSTSLKVKKAAEFFGADLVGIVEYNQTDKPGKEPSKYPFEPKSIIIVAVEIDYEASKSESNLIAISAVGAGYSKVTAIAQNVATFLRQLGYWAIICEDDPDQIVPLAVAAGLGEYGGNGQLITKEYGSRVQLVKIITELRLNADQPVALGIRNTCTICWIGNQNCHTQAISLDREVEEKNNSEKAEGYYDNEQFSQHWSMNFINCYRCSCPLNEPRNSEDDLVNFIANTHLESVFSKQDSVGSRSITIAKAIKDWWKDDN